MRRSTDHLTDRRIRSLKAEEQQYEMTDGAVPGLALRVFPTGSKSWFLRYGPREARRRIVLGPYPALSLESARNKARELVAGVRIKDRDPMSERKAARAARRKAESATFEALAVCYLEEHAKRRKRLRAWKEDERKLRVEVLPVWGSRPAAEIRRTDVRSLLERIAEERGGVCANRTRTLISRVYSFGMEKERVESNPVHGVKRVYVEAPRERVLTEEELRGLWPLLDRLQPTVASAWRLILLTAQRPGEVLAMRWRDLERDSRGWWWNLPAELTKTNRAHRVPLSPQALAVIEALRPLTGSTEWVLASRADGKRLTWLSHSSARLRAWSGLDHFTPHDLRRTAATWLGRSGVRPDTIDQLLNHAAGRISRTYNRATYDAEKRQAVILLGDLVESVLAGEKRSNVVRIG
ncbi:MAG TPA: tyrosine-type recombinase/integrase [Thermoanaerobaculia bacterium]|jgi:integrase|nr:tyrosine-type recombinase/integrase [Thermoanaerobaculia bacterium]